MKKSRPLDAFAVGVIPDGNRRWARQNKYPLDRAYWIAMKKLAKALDTLLDLGAACVCIYALSADNLQRRRDDLCSVLRAEERFFTELLPSVKEKHALKVFHAGRSELLPDSYNRCLSSICDKVADRQKSKPSLFLCAAYDPYDEVLDNRDRLTDKGNDVVAALWVPKRIDMVIRTGGDCRLSGFLPLQCKYAEFFFEPYYFPDITRRHVKKLVGKFLRRERRLGTDASAAGQRGSRTSHNFASRDGRNQSSAEVGVVVNPA